MKFYKLVLAIMIASILLVVIGETMQNNHIVTTYENALELISAERYEEALNNLKTIRGKDYQDTFPWIFYCNAKIAYAAGDIDEAYDECYFMQFEYLSEEREKEIDAFKKKVEEEYDEYLKREYQKRQLEYEQKVKTGVPFVGMSESDIDKTILGAPSSDIRHNSENINGERYDANLYDFYLDSELIYTARCVQGKVTEVWDYRDAPISKRKKSYVLKRKEKDYDPYDASEYNDPEDFYYDNYDDFWDYEEAEDYWNEFN